MPRPGVDVVIGDETTQGGAILDTSQAFMAGPTQRGVAGTTRAIHSFKEFKDRYGARTVDSDDLYDAARGFFEAGGTTMYVSPYYGVTAVAAQADLGTVFHVVAAGPGAWGNDVDVRSVAPTTVAELQVGAGAVVYEVLYLDQVVARSPAMLTQADVISWMNQNQSYTIWSVFTGGGATTALVPGLTAGLSGGVTNYTWSGTRLRTALDVFDYDLGPGQVLAPGRMDSDSHLAVGEHAQANHRVGIVDLPNSNDPLVISAAMANIDGNIGRNLLAVGPWHTYPAETSPATISVPSSGITAGIIGRVDKRGDLGASAAGADGISSQSLGLSQVYDDDDRRDLNQLGASLYKEKLGTIRLYGYRTAAGVSETNWMFFQEARVVMAIAHECNAAMEEYVLKTMDGRKTIQGKVHVSLSGICLRYYNDGALYGATPSEAFRIDADTPNTIDTIKLGEFHANVWVKTSKLAEWIQINLIKSRIETALAA